MAAQEAEIHEIRQPADLDSAARVLSRAFLENPIEKAALHRNVRIRKRQLCQLFGGLIRAPSIEVQGVNLAGEVVGVAAVTPFDQCSLKVGDLRPLVGPVLRVGPLSLARFVYWMARWHIAEPKRPHRHLQLLGVTPPHQGKGIGSLLLRWYCDQLDSTHQFAYHETDKPENLVFYGRQGFQVIGETRVLGVTTWRLAREPHSAASASAGS